MDVDFSDMLSESPTRRKLPLEGEGCDHELVDRSPPLVGIDLVDTAHLQLLLKRTPTLSDELFTLGELDYSNAQTHPIQHLAARYAAKEAVVKALGLDGFDPLDIEVVGGGEHTTLVLHGSAALRAEQLGVVATVSMSHLPHLAVAIVLALPTAGGTGP